MSVSTLFVIAVTTSRMIMPGMPDMGNIPGMNMPGFGAPDYALTMDLYSDKKVDKSSKAQCAIPEGLKLGPSVDLYIDLPARGEIGPGAEEDSDKPEQGKAEKFVFKQYWMCAEVVPQGQPRVITIDPNGKMSDADIARMQKMSKRMMNRFPMAGDKSRAYWPKPGEDPIKDNKQHCPGLYNLTTNYTGGTSVTLDNNQDFLAPIELLNPGKKMPDLKDTIMVEWKSVPNALAYILSAFSFGDNEMISWTSSADPEVTADAANQIMVPAEVEKQIKAGVFLPADKTSCRIPAGIFNGKNAPMITVYAIGTDKVREKDGIITHVIVRSHATVMSGEGMGMDEEDPGDEPTDEEPRSQEADNKDEDSVEQADDGVNKAGKVKDTLKKAKDLFKW